MKLADHVDHEWREVGRCVYCVPCGLRLFQGKIAKDRQAQAMRIDSVFEKIMQDCKDGKFDEGVYE